MKRLDVAVIVGSDSDLATMVDATDVLELFGVAYKVSVASAHRTPEKVRQLVSESEKSGVKVFIAAAGMAAALPGVIAAETVKPVIGVPLVSKYLDGMDALLSISQMPPGIPVATVAIGKAGAKNAAIIALEILAVKDPKIEKKLGGYRKNMAASVNKKDEELQKLGIKKFVASRNKA
jgi:phosphoribosylaminoimidazole carboxylase PurE protein